MGKAIRVRDRAILAVGVLLLSIGLDGLRPAVADDPSLVSFRRDIQPILNARCVVCHVAGAESAGLNLQRSMALNHLLGVPSTQAPLDRVTPGAPEDSYLVHKLRGTQAKVGGSGAAMPFTDGNVAPLSDAELRLIERWIAEGARSQ